MCELVCVDVERVHHNTCISVTYDTSKIIVGWAA